MWNTIESQEQLAQFLYMLADFHDSCIKEMHYLSGAYVQENRAMHPVNDQRVLRMIIQRQFWEHSVIELEFRGLRRLSLIPATEYYTCEILDATMILSDDGIFWCDCGGLSPEDIDGYSGVAICADSVRWRDVEEHIGPDPVYVIR